MWTFSNQDYNDFQPIITSSPTSLYDSKEPIKNISDMDISLSTVILEELLSNENDNTRAI